MKRDGIRLGFEVGSGEPVYIPAHHLVATGTSQKSGKTTTLEALITRSNLKAVAFRTKRGESGFSHATRHPPFFRERADWQYVKNLLEATMKTGLRFEQSWIIKVSKGAKTLRDVRDNVRAALASAKRGIDEGVYTNLNAYLDIVIPALDRVVFATELDLQPGINVIDLIGLPDEVQSLVIASTIEAIHATHTKVVIVLPEAAKFIPEGRGSPVKGIVERVTREGAALEVYVWFDSQDITGVDKTPLKNVEVWILGRQREMNEIKRTLDQIPLPKSEKPPRDEVARLDLGHFFVCSGKETRLVYVQPAWLDEATAKAVARGELSGVTASKRRPSPWDGVEKFTDPSSDDTPLAVELTARMRAEEDEDMTKEEVERLQAEKKQLLADKIELERNVHALKKRLEAIDALQDLKDHVRPKPEPTKPVFLGVPDPRVHLNVTTKTPRLSVTKEEVTIEAGDDMKGRVAQLIADGFFGDSTVTNEAIIKEFYRRGWGNYQNGAGRTNMKKTIHQLAEWGFFTIETDGYRVNPDVVHDRIKISKKPIQR